MGGKIVEEDPKSVPLAHDLRQPMNIIRLACGNLRVRLLPELDPDIAAYLEQKLDRIEQQVERMNGLIGDRHVCRCNEQSSERG